MLYLLISILVTSTAITVNVCAWFSRINSSSSSSFITNILIIIIGIISLPLSGFKRVKASVVYVASLAIVTSIAMISITIRLFVIVMNLNEQETFFDQLNI